MSELSAQEFALAIVIAVADRRKRLRRREQRDSAFIDGCIEMLDDNTFSPQLIRYRPDGWDPTDARRRQLCADTRELFERVAPVVRVLAER
jgi:hypothetical protein